MDITDVLNKNEDISKAMLNEFISDSRYKNCIQCFLRKWLRFLEQTEDREKVKAFPLKLDKFGNIYIYDKKSNQTRKCLDTFIELCDALNNNDSTLIHDIYLPYVLRMVMDTFCEHAEHKQLLDSFYKNTQNLPLLILPHTNHRKIIVVKKQ